MRFFTRSRRPARPGPTLRSTLRLEELSTRAVPSGLDDPPYSPPPYTPPPPLVDPPPFGNPPPPTFIPPPMGNPPPVIDQFNASEVGHGWYMITGHVVSAAAGGLTVTFDGIPALVGRTAMTAADGSFSLVIQVQTNGNDTGTITAQTVDANGIHSEFAYAYVNPTP